MESVPALRHPQANNQVPPPPYAGSEKTFTIAINPQVLRWIAPAALLLVLLLLLSPWTGVYPGGYGVYTQSGLQMIWGGYSVSEAGEKVVGMEKAIDGAIRANWLLLIYVLLILAALTLAAAAPVLAHLSYPPPGALQLIWPFRTVLVVVATLLAFLILLTFVVSGSGFENAVIAAVEKSPEKKPFALIKQDQSEQGQIERGLKMSRLNLARTFWLQAAVFAHLLALTGAGLDLWMATRGGRPLPRLEARW